MTGEADARLEAMVSIAADWCAACDREGEAGFPTAGQLDRLEAAFRAFDIAAAPFAREAVASYLAVLASALGPHVPLAAVDPRGSALLRRLLGGRPPLEHAPPLHGGRPWYDLAETPGPHRCCVAGEADMSHLLGELPPGDDGRRLLVNGAAWVIAERRTDGSFEVLWRGRGAPHEVRREGGVWVIERMPTGADA